VCDDLPSAGTRERFVVFSTLLMALFSGKTCERALYEGCGGLWTVQGCS